MKHTHGNLLIILFVIELFVFVNSVTRKRKNYVEVTEISEILRNMRTNATTTVSPFDTDESALHKLYTLMLQRLNYTVEEARYKWKNGIEIMVTKERYDDILKNAEKQADEILMEKKDAVQFMMDEIEAASIIEYSLTSSWYANKIETVKISPENPKLEELSVIREKIDKLQKKILIRFSKLGDIRTNRHCCKIVGNTIFDEDAAKDGSLFRIALQMSMASFCKVFIFHVSPFQTRTPTPKYRTTKKYRYRRKPRIYTPPTPKPDNATDPPPRSKLVPSSQYSSLTPSYESNSDLSSSSSSSSSDSDSS